MDSNKTDKSPAAEEGVGASEADGGVRGAGAEAGGDPKNVAELTHYIQSMLQQMQDRSDAQTDQDQDQTFVSTFHVEKHVKSIIFFSRFQTMSDQIIGRIDDMSSRIDDLEHNINDLMSQAGQSGPPAIEKEK